MVLLRYVPSPSSRSVRVTTGTLAALLVTMLAGACEERFPREDAPPGSATGDAGSGDANASGDAADDAAEAGPPPIVTFAEASPVTFTAPVEVVKQGNRLYVLEQGGTIRLLSEDLATATVVADVSDRLVGGGEAGLLGLAFHPSFATNGYVYLYYTVPHPTQPPPAGVVFQSAIVRYESKDGGLTLDLTTEKRIMTVDQPYANHNGGTIAFGKDGMLYWGLGDGGSGGDPQNHAQDKSSLLGKMLRIDVDGGDPYVSPPSNPFAAGGGLPEIYALGFRNPYRFRFDDVSGDLWVGDVGQGAREEIDKVTLGGNYGWRIREGKTCYNAMTCDSTGLVDPVVDHPRSEAAVITGGVVYHGTAIPQLTGKYVYADFGTGFFFAIPTNETAPRALRIDGTTESLRPSAFAIDKDGEVVFTSYFGKLHRVVPLAKP